MARLWRLGAALLLALYAAALFGAPAAHGLAGADPRHTDAAPHDQRLSDGTGGGSPFVHLDAACAICQWTAANSGACPGRPLLLAEPAASSPLPGRPPDLPPSGPLASLAEARAPPAA